MWRHGILLLCTLVLAAELSSGSSLEELERYCVGDDDGETLLQHGLEYHYQYQSEAVGAAVGTTDDTTQMIIKCNVQVSHVKLCIYSLKLSECKLTASGGPPHEVKTWMDNYDLSVLSQYPVSFALNTGEIKSIFVDNNDPLHSVNIKRGVLSLFVLKKSAATGNAEEMHTDIHGTCPWKSAVDPDESGHVHSSKDMLHCAFPSRPDWYFSPWSIFWNMSFIQYLINSSFDCDYNLNLEEGRIGEVLCKERHAIKLESTHQTTTAVQTNIQCAMNFVEAKSSGSASDVTRTGRKTGIQFEYNHTPDPVTQPPGFLETAEKMMTDLVQTSADEMRLFTIPMFHDFVAWLRASSDLLPFVESVTSCGFIVDCPDRIKGLAMDYLRDGLVQCNSVPCVRAFSHLVTSGHVTTAYVRAVLFSWSNIYNIRPAFIEETLKICKVKDMRFCWLLLGKLINKFDNENPHTRSELPPEIEKVTDYIYNKLGSRCDLDEGTYPEDYSDSQKLNDKVTFLKAIGNIGRAYKTVTNGFKQLHNCALNKDASFIIKLGAVQALQTIEICEEKRTCNYMYRRLMPVLKDPSWDIELRIVIYQLLILNADKLEFAEDLSKLLKEESVSQLKSYIASHLKVYIKESEEKGDHEKFILKFKKACQDYEVDIDSLTINPRRKSNVLVHERFVNLPFMPKEISGFGAKLEINTIYGLLSSLPQSVSANLTMELFSKVFNLLEVEIFGRGWKTNALWFLKHFPDNPEEIHRWMSFNTIEILQKIGIFPSMFPEMDDSFVVPFNHAFEENIRKLRNVYYKMHMKEDPTVMTFIKFLGKNLGIFSLKDIAESVSPEGLSVDPEKFTGNLRDGVTYNSTHVIRVIEAYHQVPTMMGLPLNWTTNATLAYSVRAGVQADFGGEGNKQHFQGSVYFHPSGALTFLNRMVLDLPTVTQIGVQANTSAYTSTQWEVHVNISEKDNLRVISLQRPEKTQKILELFRTNQLIKHHTAQEIEDWDIERVHVSKCTDDSFNKAIGVQYCFEKSYANVTHRIKPWFLMAGWAKWRLERKPFDKELKSYNLALEKAIYHPFYSAELKLNAPGSFGRREVDIKITQNKLPAYLTVLITAPERPGFEINFSKAKYMDKDIKDGDGHRTVLSVKRTNGHKYQFTFMRFEGVENRTLTKPHKEGTVTENVKKLTATFQTPFNMYQWTDVIRKSSKNIKVDSLLSYENFNSSWNWLDNILPPVFWEDSKAWIQVQGDWDIAESNEKGGHHRHSTTYVYLPHSSIHVITHSLRMTGRSYFRVNATKNEAGTGKVLSFVNFGYDSWTTDGGKAAKHVYTYNFTMPRLSWVLNYLKTKQDNTELYNVTLCRAKMHAKDNNVGWWSPESEDEFYSTELKSQLLVHLTHNAITSSHLPEPVVKMMEKEKPNMIENIYDGYATTAEVSLFFPYKGKEESIIFNGKFIKMYSASPNYWSFQKEFVLKSSLLNLQLDSYSVYAIPGVLSAQALFHKSFITHFTTGNKAYYDLSFLSAVKDGCQHVDLLHNITSRIYDFSSYVRQFCQPETLGNVLEIAIDTHSSYWDKLNSKLRQIFHNKYPRLLGGESMNFSSPLADINVVANWDDGSNTIYEKHAILTSKTDKIPNMEANIKDLSSGLKEAALEVNYEEPHVFKMHRQLSSDFKKSHYRFSHKLGDAEEVKDLEMDVKLVTPYHLSVHGSVTVDSLYKLKDWVKSKAEVATRRFVAAAKDPDHPLNKMVEPNLGMTLAEFWQLLKEEAKETEEVIKQNVYEALESLAPFSETSVAIASNSYKELVKLMGKADEKFKRTYTGWAFHYFNLPEVFHDLCLKTPDILFGLLKIYTRGSLGGTTIEFSGQQALPFYVKSFRKFPILEEKPFSEQWFSHQKQLSTDFMTEKGKVGLIFGPHHVYTFDGVFIEFPSYPAPGCSVLLAHDPYSSSFSAVTSETALHLIFPEMTLSINDKNELYVNGSKEQHSVPLQSTNGKITVKREGRILTVSSPGLNVACDDENMLCAFTLHYLHTGGIFGLLGNADGETYNEYKLPDDSYAHDIAGLSKAYEISGDEGCKDFKTPQKPSWDDHESERYKCNRVLYSRCLETYAATKAFEKACLLDIIQEDKACYTQAGMAAFCHLLSMKAENECEKISPPNKEAVSQRLEVVLIVDEYSVMFHHGSNQALKGLESVIDAIENKFHSEGYASITYSLVGFRGNGLHCKPHLVTLKSDLWVPHKDIINTLKLLSFDGRNYHDPDCSTTQAVQYAVDYLGFNTMDSKVLFIFTRNDTKHLDAKTLNLVRKKLEENGLTLYTFANYPSIQKGKHVFGVRADGYIFPPSDNSNAYLEYPKGMLAKLTSATRGSLFVQQFVEDNAPSAFFSTVADEVWAKVHHEAKMCRSCELESGMHWNRRKKCSLIPCKK